MVCAVAACLAVGSPAAAQRPVGGPFTGLIKGSPKDQPQTLDVMGSAFTGWDDNVLAQTPFGGGDNPFQDPRLIKPGQTNGFQGSVAYGFRKAGTRSQLNVTGDASIQQYGAGLSSGASTFHSYSASARLRTSVTNKTAFSLSTSASYLPYYRYAPFLANTMSEESPVSSDIGYAVDSEMVRSFTAGASVENRLTKKSNILAGIGWEQRVIPGEQDASLDMRTASVGFNHALTRKLGFHVTYMLQESRNGFNRDVEPVHSHLMDIGLGYGDGVTLSFGRHYTLNMSLNTGIAKNGDPASVVTTGKSTAFIVGGVANLSRSIGRTWGASIGYGRDTHYMVGFSQLVTSDSANTGIGGPITDRLLFSAGAGATRSHLVFAESSEPLISYTASTRLTFALFRHLGLYAQASYYRYSIPPGFINFGFAPDVDRRSASAGLSAWLPLIKPPRKRTDSSNQPPTGQP